MDQTAAPGTRLQVQAGNVAALRPTPVANPLALIDDLFTVEHRQQIARYLSIEADDPALTPYLAVCAQYGFHPMLGHVWLIPQRHKLKDAQGRETGEETEKLRPAVGRDGLLSVAFRTPEYRGMQSAVVHENDDFEVAYTGDFEHDPIVHHRAAAPAERGSIVGAWAKVYLTGRAPTYYFAPIKEHAKIGQNRRGEKYWKGAWSYTSVMALKAAQSVALRLSLGVTGMVPADEIRPEVDLESEAPEGDPIEAAVEGLRLPDDVGDELIAAIAELNRREPNAWTSAKVTLRLTGRGEEGAREALREIRDELEAAQAEEERTRREREEGREVQASEVAPGVEVRRTAKDAWAEVTDVVDGGEDSEQVVIVCGEDSLECAPSEKLLVRPVQGE